MSVPNFIVNLDGYEGPLDLLLSLAKEQKVDLSKISILQLADQYLTFIDRIKSSNLEVAADYLVMAAWLALIKSKLLLPEDDEHLAKEITENLALQIARLNHVRELGERLATRDRLGTNFFAVGFTSKFERKVEIKYEASLADLLRAYLKIETKREFSPLQMNMDDFVSIETAMDNLKETLSFTSDWITLEEVLKNLGIEKNKNWKSAIAATFSASLELAKRGEIILEQRNLFDRISFRGAN